MVIHTIYSTEILSINKATRKLIPMVLYLFHIIAIFSFEKVNILKILNNYVESIYFMDINCTITAK